MPPGLVFEYDTNHGIAYGAFKYSSTIIPCVVTDKEFWLFFFINITVFSLRKLGFYHPEEFHMDLPFGLTGTTGGLMTFFVVFYTGHVFARYNDLYDLTKEMLERCVETAVLLRVNVKDERVRAKVAKLVLTSCFIFIFERTGVGGSDDTTNTVGGETLSRREWVELQALDLITREEMAGLDRHCKQLRDDAMPSFLVLQWSIELLRHSTEEPNNRFDMLDAFDSCFYRCYSCQSAVVNIMELPMPFQYFHIMNLMLMLNLLLWAYSLALQDSFFAPLIYMFVQLMFQGMRELATSLSNPFGVDDVDFPLDKWVRDVWDKVHGILNCKSEASLNLPWAGKVYEDFTKPMQRPARAVAVVEVDRASDKGEI